MRKTPQFPREFDHYLTLNGWKRDPDTCSWISYRRRDLQLIIKGETLDLLIRCQEDAPGPLLHLLHSFTGWAQLTEFTWMLLLHVTNAIPLQQFHGLVRKEMGATQEQLAEEVFKHFNTSTLPVAY